MWTRTQRFDAAMSACKAARKVRSLRHLAEQVGMSHQHLSLWKLGKILETSKEPAIAEALGVSLEWLLTGHGPGLEWDTPPIHEGEPIDMHMGPPTPRLMSTHVVSVNRIEIPVLGTVAASDGQYHGIIDGASPSAYRWRDGRALVQVHGNSAYPVIYPGQWAIVEPDRPVRHNNLVVLVLDDDSALIKRWCAAKEAPGGGVWASVNAGVDSPWIAPERIKHRWPVVGVFFE